jgi:cytochrome c peroxidase
MKINIAIVVLAIIFTIAACKKDGDLSEHLFNPTPYTFEVVPGRLPSVTPKPLPADNVATREGVALGRMLFYDPILSGNNSQSCASCHHQEKAFTDYPKFSRGIDGSVGDRNAMPLFNLMWSPTLFWDGRDANLEEQALHPIENPIEMKASLPDVLAKLNASPTYPQLFFKAFGTRTITKQHLGKALAQFERSIISCNSRYDKIVADPFDKDSFSAGEARGFLLFTGNNEKIDGDCIHCHTIGSTFTDFDFKNNGLDAIPKDSGRYLVTKRASDIGKFKTPTVRNIALTAPYMHDGRFNTLEEVMDHYNINFHEGGNLDPAMVVQVKARLTKQNRNDIIAFLKTLTDSVMITNPAYSKPQ